MKATLVMVIAAALLTSPAGATSVPGGRCLAAKIMATAKKTSAKLRCHALGAPAGLAADPACLMKAEARFSAAWSKIEAKGGCFTLENEAMIEARVDDYVSRVVNALLPFVCTTTTTFPPCAAQHAFCSGFSFGCPGGQSCTADVSGDCGCVGPPPPCGSAGTSFCAVGSCPSGRTCTVENGFCGPIGCACR